MTAENPTVVCRIFAKIEKKKSVTARTLQSVIKSKQFHEMKFSSLYADSSYTILKLIKKGTTA
jgi:hypothetical protein